MGQVYRGCGRAEASPPGFEWSPRRCPRKVGAALKGWFAAGSATPIGAGAAPTAIAAWCTTARKAAGSRKYFAGSCSNRRAQPAEQKRQTVPSYSRFAAALAGLTLIPQTGSRSIANSLPVFLPANASAAVAASPKVRVNRLQQLVIHLFRFVLIVATQRLGSTMP